MSLYSIINQIMIIIGPSLSEPHLGRSMAGSAMYICMSRYVQPSHFCCVWPLQFGTQLHALVTCLVWFGAKMTDVCKRYKFSLRSASNDRYIERNKSSSPPLSTVNDVWCKIGKTGDCNSCTVIHSSGAQITLVRRHSGHRVPCIPAAREAAGHCVCSRPWLQPLAAYCRHSFCTCKAIHWHTCGDTWTTSMAGPHAVT